MAWQDVTSLKKLTIKLEDGSNQGTIYGNGRHQIGVLIYVEALDKDRNIISVTPSEIIQNVLLIDGFTEKTLKWKGNSGWNYTNTANDFHSIPNTRMRRDTSGTWTKLYIYCAPDERQRTKSIAVKATLSNGKTYSTSDNGTQGFSSKVTISAHEEKVYTMDAMKLEEQHTRNGEMNLRNYKIEWDQHNYYFYIDENKHPGCYIETAEISGYNETEGANQVSKYAFYNEFSQEYPKFFHVGYIWPMSNSQQSKNVVLYASQSNRCGRCNDPSTNIKINQKEHAITLTRLAYIGKINTLWKNWAVKNENLSVNLDTNITIYDQYGNRGKFHAEPGDRVKEPGYDELIERVQGASIKVFNNHI